MKNILNNLSRKTIPLALALSQACYSPEPTSPDKLKEYTLKNKALYTEFKKLIKEKLSLSAKDIDGDIIAWINNKKDCIYITKKYDFDKTITLTFIDYNGDGLTINDEYTDGITKSLKELNQEDRLLMAERYTWEIKKLLQENKNKN